MPTRGDIVLRVYSAASAARVLAGSHERDTFRGHCGSGWTIQADRPGWWARTWDPHPHGGLLPWAEAEQIIHAAAPPADAKALIDAEDAERSYTVRQMHRTRPGEPGRSDTAEERAERIRLHAAVQAAWAPIKAAIEAQRPLQVDLFESELPHEA